MKYKINMIYVLFLFSTLILYPSYFPLGCGNNQIKNLPRIKVEKRAMSSSVRTFGIVSLKPLRPIVVFYNAIAITISSEVGDKVEEGRILATLNLSPESSAETARAYRAYRLAKLEWDMVNGVLIIPRFSGSIISVNAHEGQKVRKGTVIARVRLDPSVQERLARLKVDWENAKAELDRLVLEEELGRSKHERGTLSDMAWEQLKAQANIARTREKMLSQQMSDLAGGVGLSSSSIANNTITGYLRSPAAGSIVGLNIQPGQRIDPQMPSPLGAVKTVSSLKKSGPDRTDPKYIAYREAESAWKAIAETMGQHPDDPDIQLDTMFLRSPINGKVVWINPILSANNLIPANTRAFVVGGDKDYSILAKVHEADVGKIKVGASAKVDCNAISGQILMGTVTRIALYSDEMIQDLYSQYNVEIALDDPRASGVPADLRAGYTCKVDIQYINQANVIVLPLLSIHMGSNAYCMKWNGSSFIETPVTLGAISETEVIILSGINEGDEVLRDIR